MWWLRGSGERQDIEELRNMGARKKEVNSIVIVVFIGHGKISPISLTFMWKYYCEM